MRTHQILCIERNLIPPGGDKLIVAVEDAAVHVLVPPRIEKWFKPAQPGGGDRRKADPRANVIFGSRREAFSQKMKAELQAMQWGKKTD